MIVRARLEGGRCRRGPVEMYDRGRYFTMTGDRLAGCCRMHRCRGNGSSTSSAPGCSRHRRSDQPRAPGSLVVPDDDRELLERAFRAKNGLNVEQLFRGDMSGYGSRTARPTWRCVAHLAFWTGGDPARIDALFRSSGLMRDKWERADYRARTIDRALGRHG